MTFFSPVSLAPQRLVDGDADGMAGLGCGKDALDARELFRRLEYFCLLHRHGAHIAFVVQLGHDGAHAVVAQPARMVGRGHEAGCPACTSSPAA